MEKVKKDWDNKIHIISDEEFFAILTDNEYQLFCALKIMAHHDSKGNSYLYIDEYEETLNMKQLAEQLELQGRIAHSKVSRQQLTKTFKSLVEKGVLTKDILYTTNNIDVWVYFLVNENLENYKFTKIDARLLEGMTKCLRGQVIKTYIYIKANYEYNKSKGNETFFKRETLAKAINEVNKKGDIKKAQLENITQYMTFLYNLGLIKACIHVRREGSKYTSIMQVQSVYDELKTIPKVK